MIGRAGKVLRLVRVMRILRVFKVDKRTNWPQTNNNAKISTKKYSDFAIILLSFLDNSKVTLIFHHDLYFFSLLDTLLGFNHFCPLWHRFKTNVTDNHVLIDSSTNTKILLIIIITILPWKVYKEITLLMCLVLVSVLTFSRWKSSEPIYKSLF